MCTEKTLTTNKTVITLVICNLIKKTNEDCLCGTEKNPTSDNQPILSAVQFAISKSPMGHDLELMIS